MKKLVLAGFGLMAYVGVGYAAGIRVNTTESGPRGVYFTTALGKVERDTWVTACPTITPALMQGISRGYVDAGQCPQGFMPLLKHVVAVAGDHVEVAPDGSLSVNGRPIANSRPLIADTQGRALMRVPSGAYDVPAGYVWLVNSVPKSFDGRYFGPVRVGDLTGRSLPVVTE